MAAMTKKEKMAAKSKKIRDKEQRREKLTNWYMINLSFGILAIIAVLILRQLYLMPSMLSYMQIVTWVMTGVFAAAAIVVLSLGLTGKIKNKQRAVNYSIFLGVCALGSLWLALYNKISGHRAAESRGEFYVYKLFPPHRRPLLRRGGGLASVCTVFPVVPPSALHLRGSRFHCRFYPGHGTVPQRSQAGRRECRPRRPGRRRCRWPWQ